jgi:hypothetical protein
VITGIGIVITGIGGRDQQDRGIIVITGIGGS